MERLKVQIQLIIGGKMPKRKSAEAACFDCYAREIAIEREYDDAGGVKLTCCLGFSAKPPVGYKIVIVPRSSFTKTKWVCQNSPGQGDRDYTGEYHFVLRNIGKYDGSIPFDVESENGVCQMYIQKVEDFDFEQVHELEMTERGNGCFGSTDVARAIEERC
jgi:dUTP pyrophosphatase